MTTEKDPFKNALKERWAEFGVIKNKIRSSFVGDELIDSSTKVTDHILCFLSSLPPPNPRYYKKRRQRRSQKK